MQRVLALDKAPPDADKGLPAEPDQAPPDAMKRLAAVPVPAEQQQQQQQLQLLQCRLPMALLPSQQQRRPPSRRSGPAGAGSAASTG